MLSFKRRTDLCVPQFDNHPDGPLTTLSVTNGIGTNIYTDFSVAAPPSPLSAETAPSHPIAHLRPASAPNYIVADNGAATIEVTSFQNLVGFSFGCAERAAGMLPGYPKACTLSVEVACQDLSGFAPGSTGALPLRTQSREFNFAPGVGDEALVDVSVRALVVAALAPNLDAIGLVPGYIGCPLTNFTATGVDGPIALYLDNAVYLSTGSGPA